MAGRTRLQPQLLPLLLQLLLGAVAPKKPKYEAGGGTAAGGLSTVDASNACGPSDDSGMHDMHDLSLCTVVNSAVYYAQAQARRRRTTHLMRRCT
jgi:hypothetical protein